MNLKMKAVKSVAAAGIILSMCTGVAFASIGSATVMYGNFIQAILNFLIMAFVVFCMVKALNRFHKKKEAAPPPPPAPSAEEQLLTEIRDLLKNR